MHQANLCSVDLCFINLFKQCTKKGTPNQDPATRFGNGDQGAALVTICSWQGGLGYWLKNGSNAEAKFPNQNNKIYK